jgi:hypothetical protein
MSLRCSRLEHTSEFLFFYFSSSTLESYNASMFWIWNIDLEISWSDIFWCASHIRVCRSPCIFSDNLLRKSCHIWSSWLTSRVGHLLSSAILRHFGDVRRKCHAQWVWEVHHLGRCPTSLHNLALIVFLGSPVILQRRCWRWTDGFCSESVAPNAQGGSSLRINPPPSRLATSPSCVAPCICGWFVSPQPSSVLGLGVSLPAGLFCDLASVIHWHHLYFVSVLLVGVFTTSNAEWFLPICHPLRGSSPWGSVGWW